MGLRLFCLLAVIAIAAARREDRNELGTCTRTGPVTYTYAEIAKEYGINQSEADAGFLPTMDSSNPIIADPADPELPEQVLISYHSATEVAISWFTGLSQMTNDSSTAPFVPPNLTALATEIRYGPKLLQSATGNASSYRMTYYFPHGIPYYDLTTGQLGTHSFYLNYTSGVQHTVTLAGLTPSTDYLYQVGDFASGKVSDVLSFKTLPAQSASTFEPIRVGFFADIGLSINSSETVARLVQSNLDLAVLVGDFCYANIFDATGEFSYFVVDGAGGQYSNSVRWDQFGRMLEPLVSKMPFLSSHGNHEREFQVDDGGVHFRPWLMRYGNHMPYAKSGGSPFFYSTNAGPLHVIAMSPYVPFYPGSDQYTWLEGDLAAIDRSTTPWVVAMFHAPWYVTVSSHFQENECHRQATEALLFKYGVDLIFNGHSHVYERSHKVTNYTLNDCGAVNIVIGDAGIGLNTVFADTQLYAPTLSNTTTFYAGPCQVPQASVSGAYVWLNTTQSCQHTYSTSNNNFCPATQPDYSAIRDVSVGMGYFDFVNATHAKWTFMRNAAPADSPVTDEAWIVRDPACATANM